LLLLSGAVVLSHRVDLYDVVVDNFQVFDFAIHLAVDDLCSDRFPVSWFTLDRGDRFFASERILHCDSQVGLEIGSVVRPPLDVRLKRGCSVVSCPGEVALEDFMDCTQDEFDDFILFVLCRLVEERDRNHGGVRVVKPEVDEFVFVRFELAITP